MEILNFEQGSQEWLKFRARRITATTLHAFMGERGFGKGASSEFSRIVSSHRIETFSEGFQNFAMSEGKKNEIFVAEQIKIQYPDYEFQNVGCICSNIDDFFSVSPDLISFKNKVGSEIKCPQNTTNHWELLNCQSAEELKSIEPKYYWQIQAALFISQYPEWWLFSYHNDYEPEYKLGRSVITPVTNDQNLIADRVAQAEKLIKKELEKFGIIK